MAGDRENQEEKELISTKGHLDSVFSYFLRTAQARQDQQGCVTKAERTLRKAAKILSDLVDNLFEQERSSKQLHQRTAVKNEPTFESEAPILGDSIHEPGPGLSQVSVNLSQQTSKVRAS